METALIWLRNDLEYALTTDLQWELNVIIGEDYPEPMIDIETSYERIRERR
jgi:deoxyribodipyrimidine photolyase